MLDASLQCTHLSSWVSSVTCQGLILLRLLQAGLSTPSPVCSPPALQQQMASSGRCWLRQSSSVGNEDRLTHPPSLICNSWMQAVDRAQAFALKHPAWIAKHHCILTHWGWLNVLPSASVWDTHSIMLGYCKSLTCCAVDRSGFSGRKFPF